jgi:hypothetical protein
VHDGHGDLAAEGGGLGFVDAGLPAGDHAGRHEIIEQCRYGVVVDGADAQPPVRVLPQEPPGRCVVESVQTGRDVSGEHWFRVGPARPREAHLEPGSLSPAGQGGPPGGSVRFHRVGQVDVIDGGVLAGGAGEHRFHALGELSGGECQAISRHASHLVRFGRRGRSPWPAGRRWCRSGIRCRRPRFVVGLGDEVGEVGSRRAMTGLVVSAAARCAVW